MLEFGYLEAPCSPFSLHHFGSGLRTFASGSLSSHLTKPPPAIERRKRCSDLGIATADLQFTKGNTLDYLQSRDRGKHQFHPEQRS